jgi:hypothetical protein
MSSIGFVLGISLLCKEIKEKKNLKVVKKKVK